jgi:hypothetical protein
MTAPSSGAATACPRALEWTIRVDVAVFPPAGRPARTMLPAIRFRFGSGVVTIAELIGGCGFRLLGGRL